MDSARPSKDVQFIVLFSNCMSLSMCVCGFCVCAQQRVHLPQGLRSAAPSVALRGLQPICLSAAQSADRQTSSRLTWCWDWDGSGGGVGMGGAEEEAERVVCVGRWARG